MLVEGHGEVGAAGNLVSRLWTEQGQWLPWAPPIRWPNLHLRRGIDKGVSFIRAKRDAGALLILRDEDDACPATRGPEMAAWVRDQAAPFPVAVVLLRREFETLFLPCVDLIAGRPIVGPDGRERPGLLPETRFDGEWESVRGVKEWLRNHFPPGRAYKPTMDQLPMTRMLDLDRVRSANVPSFGTLERALGFLADHVAEPGVYP